MRKMKESIKSYNPILIRQDCIERFSEEAVTRQLGRIYEEVLEK